MTTYKEYRNGGEGFAKWMEDNVCIEIHPIGETIPRWTPIGDLPDKKSMVTNRSYKYMWEQQKEMFSRALEMKNGNFIHRLIVLCWMRGEGKCEKKGSKVLMFDGNVKKVEDVVVGDLLMGDDNTPREVLSLASGKEEMFEVTPMRGEPMVVTADHKLSLKRRRACINKRGKPFNDVNAGKIIDIPLKDVMEKSKCWTGLNLLYRVPIDWPEQEVPIDPYFFGAWLGDGSKGKPSVTTMDKEVIDYLYAFADSLSMRVTINTKKDNEAATYCLVTERGKNNPLLELLRNNNLANNKHIPYAYKANSREVRLKVLAGIVDTDGYINRNSIEISQKNKVLAEDIVFLARSLGFHAGIKKRKKDIKSIGFSAYYYIIGISGDCSIIPTLIPRKKCPKRSNWKDILVSGIREIKSVGENEYYGFMIDGNGRYVKGDFTVTHNSFLAVAIQVWKFCVFPSQYIVFCANSKEQTDWVHYTIARNMIYKSPNLIQRIGDKNVREKDIVIRDGSGNVVSSIRKISSFSGIVSNITGYSFSEIHEMKKPSFFTQIDGSIRNIPNAIGVIDTTVSSEEHHLFGLYKAYIDKKDKTLFFSYRSAPSASHEDYWHPMMTQDQLDSYQAKFLPIEFDRYFKNTWSSGAENVFPPELVDMIGCMGVMNNFNTGKELLELLRQKRKLLSSIERLEGDGVDPMIEKRMMSLESKFWMVDSVYQLMPVDNLSLETTEVMASINDIERLTEMFDTDWAVLSGIDRADPMKERSSARTVVGTMIKGLPGSRSNPLLVDTEGNAKYIYFQVGLAVIQDHSLDGIKAVLMRLIDEFGGIDVLCAERWGIWDMQEWADERTAKFEAVYPTYDRQKEAFTEYYNAVRDHRYKSPTVLVKGSTGVDILREEMSVFDHEADWKKFGSPQKRLRHGVQDDVVYQQAWCMYGGRFLTASDFLPRVGKTFFGFYKEGEGNLGKY